MCLFRAGKQKLSANVVLVKEKNYSYSFVSQKKNNNKNLQLFV